MTKTKALKKGEDALVLLQQAIDRGDWKSVKAWYGRRAGTPVAKQGWVHLVDALGGEQSCLDDGLSELANTYEELVFLYEMAPKLGAYVEPAQVCRAAVTEIEEVIPAEGVYIVGCEGEAAVKMAGRGRYPYGRGVAWADTFEAIFAQEDSPKIVNESGVASLPPSFRLRGRAVRNILSCGLSVQGKILGAITLYNHKRGGPFSAADGKRLHALASLSAVALYNGRLMAQVREAEALRQEMDLAREIQEGLLPRKAPTIAGAEIVSSCQMATDVGGDYFDSYFLKDGTIVLMIADVMGHGLGAALVSTMFRTIIRTISRQGLAPSEVLHHVNGQMLQEFESASTFVSCFYGIYDPSRNSLFFSNGGHNYPLVYRHGTDEVAEVCHAGPLVGIFEEAIFEDHTIHLAPGDTLLLYTDGLVEACDREKRVYGIERLTPLLKAARTNGAQKCLDKILQSLTRFRRGAPLRDDVTCLLLKLLPSEN